METDLHPLWGLGQNL